MGSGSASDQQITFELDGRTVEVPADAATLLEVLRDRLGVRSPKDGCSPQGQCGCCTVLVDGSPRVSCVTPARRVAGRTVTTLDGLPADSRTRWADAFCAAGASQCGFCTPGIVMRLEGALAGGGDLTDRAAVDKALLAHLCRCTGWQTIAEAANLVGSGAAVAAPRSSAGADQRASLEGRSAQRTGPETALGRGGFADDTAPPDALVAVADATGEWVVAESLPEARRLAGKVQGRRTSSMARPPLEVPVGRWDARLATVWVEPAYLETDASWCAPGGEPATPLANGGAFGAKTTSPLGSVARRLADRYGKPVRVLWSREDTVCKGPKRPPVAAGARADGSGTMHVVRTPGLAAAVAAVAPDLTVVEFDLPGPPTSADIRAAGWAEALVLLAGARGEVGEVRAPDGGRARAAVSPTGIDVWVDAGEPLDATVLRSYAIGAAHMAYSWVTSEGLSVDAEGRVEDLTIRSFGIVRAADLPPITVTIEPSSAPPVNGSDAVFAAVAAATWLARGCPPEWPCGLLASTPAQEERP
ncbi:MAG: 2Fe-2S iron-sulfur cluster binding domain-containing protein [Acidimicrobiales bacterium]|nr:2Fe-2S iron-sulfur cluster binding domain-containing protein [Acidimicrobiales bacterium]